MEIIITGDTGTGDKSQYLVSDAMYKFIKINDKIEAIIISGDNIYPSGTININDKQFITKFKKPYKKINLPFYLCLGNHDYGYGPTIYKTQIDYTNSINNTDNKWNLYNYYYTKSFSNLDIFFIDTNFYNLSRYKINKQLEDTINNINKSTKKWKILCGHHTWRSVGGNGNAEIKFENFMKKIINKTKFDLYVCGHDHCKSIITDGKTKIPTLVIGTGGQTHENSIFNTENLNKTKSKLHFFSPNLGFCHVKSTDNKLNLTCYDSKLNIEYKYSINK